MPGGEVISQGLISSKRPFWEVKKIAQRREYGRNDKRNDPLSSGRPEDELLPDPGADRDIAKACLASVSRMFSGEKKEGILAGPLPLPDHGVV